VNEGRKKRREIVHFKALGKGQISSRKDRERGRGSLGFISFSKVTPQTGVLGGGGGGRKKRWHCKGGRSLKKGRRHTSEKSFLGTGVDGERCAEDAKIIKLGPLLVL